MKALAATGLLLVAGSLVACGGDDSGDGDGEPLKLAVTEMKGLEELQREFGAFEAELEEGSGLDFELYPVADRAAAAVALDSDQVDLVFTGPAEYVALNARTDSTPVVGIHRPGYSSCIWTSVDSGVTSLDELTGKTIAMEDVGSTSAHLGPSQILSDAGVDPMEDVTIQFLDVGMQEALASGDVAAVGAGCHDYEEFMEGADEARFPMLEQGPDLPDDVIVARPDLDEDTVATVRSAFEDHWEDLRSAMVEGEENEKFSDAELVPAPSDSDYDVVRSMYESIGVDDFTEFVGE